jgi:proteasome accessory factor A
MSETTTLLKVGSTDLVLRMLEAGLPMRDLTLENPIRSIRDISQDPTGRRLVRLATGRSISGLDMQREYLGRVTSFASTHGLLADPTSVHARVVDLWTRVLDAIESDRLQDVATEIDWVIKRTLIDRYMAKHGLDMTDARISQLDLAYHDISRKRGLFYLMSQKGLLDRQTSDIEVFAAKSIPPQTTRAKLRGDFIKRAQEKRRDFTVDWVHLKLNDQAQRTVLCKDPFKSVDERVERLIASM